jgi:hypothetical protein
MHKAIKVERSDAIPKLWDCYHYNCWYPTLKTQKAAMSWNGGSISLVKRIIILKKAQKKVVLPHFRV